MSARTPEPCDGVNGEHTGPVRFYRTGWQCSAHSPGAQAAGAVMCPNCGAPVGPNRGFCSNCNAPIGQ